MNDPANNKTHEEEQHEPTPVEVQQLLHYHVGQVVRLLHARAVDEDAKRTALRRLQEAHMWSDISLRPHPEAEPEPEQKGSETDA